MTETEKAAPRSGDPPTGGGPPENPAVVPSASTSANAAAPCGAIVPSRPRLTGAQSFVDGVLVYGLRYDDEVLYATSKRELVDEKAADGRWRILANEKPNMDARFGRGVLNSLPSAEVSPRDVYEDIVALLRRHIVWPTPTDPHLLATWIMATYCFRIFTYIPYLSLTSLTKRSGKSLGLEILSALAFNATPPQVNVTPANLYRDIHVNACTVILDEVEALRDADREQRAMLMAVLNVGFKYDGSVSRIEDTRGSLQQTRFRAFSPKGLAGINDVTDTIRDRSLSIRLKKKRADEKVERFSARRQAAHLQNLRDRLHLFGLLYAADVAELYEAADVFQIPAVDDRLRDILEPLYAVAAVIDAHAREPVVTPHLTAAAREQAAIRGEDSGADRKVIQAVEGLDVWLAAKPDDVLTSTQAVDVFRNAGLTWVSEEKQAQGQLRKLGFKSAVHRKGGAVIRGYRITRAEVDDLKARYVPAATKAA